MGYSCKYPHALEPIIIGKQYFRNRIFSSPTGYLDLTVDAHPTAETAAYFERRAIGGVAAVTLGECAAFDKARVGGSSMYLGDPAQIPIYSAITDAVRKHGAVVSAEMTHWGKYATMGIPGSQLYGAIEDEAQMGDFGAMKQHVLPMSEEQILDVIKRFGLAAEYAKRVGFNMLTVHGAHGWLIPQFMHPSNNRTDDWGGSFENRMRLPIEILKAVRKAVGPGFPIEMRLSADERYEGGYDIEYGIRIAMALQDYVDIFLVSSGDHMNAFSAMEPSLFAPDNANLEYATAIKNHIEGALVASVGAINDPDQIEDIIASGKADIVAMARPLLADPDLVNKMREGRGDEVRHCLRCMTCFSSLMATSQFHCAVNPEVGHEFDLKQDIAPASPKKVLVIGGGPAGMQAAITAATRGHSVILCEKGPRLGGALLCEEAVPFKAKTARYLNLQAKRCEEDPNIEVRLNCEVTPEYASSLDVDAIICAIGAQSATPPIAGIEGTISGEDAFRDISKVGQNVVIMGAGLVGSELGLYLAQNGRHVDIVEMLGEVSHGGNFLHAACLRDFLVGQDVTFHFNTKAVEVTEAGLVAQDAEGNTVEFPADTVVCATGMKPLMNEAIAFSNCAPFFRQLGDCVVPANIWKATGDAYFAARDIGRPVDF